MKRDKDYGICIYLLIPIILIVLKALGLVELSWLWVLSPLWIPLGICLALAVLVLVVLVIVAVIGLVIYLIDIIKERGNKSI